MSGEKKEIKSFTDLYLVAALLSYGPLSLCKVDKSEPRRQQFHFHDNILEVYILSPTGPEKKRTPSLDEIRTWYTAGILMFPPNYVECIKRMKSEVHS